MSSLSENDKNKDKALQNLDKYIQDDSFFEYDQLKPEEKKYIAESEEEYNEIVFNKLSNQRNRIIREVLLITENFKYPLNTHQEKMFKKIEEEEVDDVQFQILKDSGRNTGRSQIEGLKKNVKEGKSLSTYIYDNDNTLNIDINRYKKAYKYDWIIAIIETVKETVKVLRLLKYLLFFLIIGSLILFHIQISHVSKKDLLFVEEKNIKMVNDLRKFEMGLIVYFFFMIIFLFVLKEENPENYIVLSSFYFLFFTVLLIVQIKYYSDILKKNPIITTILISLLVIGLIVSLFSIYTSKAYKNIVSILKETFLELQKTIQEIIQRFKLNPSITTEKAEKLHEELSIFIDKYEYKYVNENSVLNVQKMTELLKQYPEIENMERKSIMYENLIT